MIVRDATNSKSADTGITAYMKLQQDGIYEIETMSSKVDAENKPLDFQFNGFNISRTGFPIPPNSSIDTLYVTTANNVENSPVAANQQAFENYLSQIFEKTPVLDEVLRSNSSELKDEWNIRLNAYSSNKNISNATALVHWVLYSSYIHDNMVDAKKIFDNSNPQDPKWDGTGVFDIIMKAANENIKIQNQASRITGAEYAEVYLGTMQTAISEAMRFLLNKDQSTKDLEVKQANIDLLNRQREGFDDNKYQKLFEAQMNAWALMFSSGLLTTKPEIISNDSASSLYNTLKPK